jgi:hypothetical protein
MGRRPGKPTGPPDSTSLFPCNLVSQRGQSRRTRCRSAFARRWRIEGHSPPLSEFLFQQVGRRGIVATVGGSDGSTGQCQRGALRLRRRSAERSQRARDDDPAVQAHNDTRLQYLRAGIHRCQGKRNRDRQDAQRHCRFRPYCGEMKGRPGTAPGGGAVGAGQDSVALKVRHESLAVHRLRRRWKPP